MMQYRPIRHANQRRAAVGIAAVIVLVFLQLILVGFVIGGTRDQDTTIQRLDTTRAFYAAESAMNMAVRELVSYADDDNDGQAGGISNNSDAADDPQVATGVAAFAARSETAGSTTLTADGRSGSCKRRIVATIVDGTTSGRRVVYSQWPNQNPQVRVWGGANWAAPTSTMNFGGKQYWAVIRRCPIRQEVTIACSTQGWNAVAAVQTGSTWGSLLTASNDLGTLDQRPFYFAYEQSTGNGMIVARSGNSATLHYRTWNGSVWSADNSITSPLTGSPTFIKMIPKPGSAEIMLYVIDSNNSIAAMVWNGTSWGNKVTLEASAPGSTIECADAAYETNTGRCMLIWGHAGSGSPRYAFWTGSGWSSTGTMSDVGSVPQWFHLAADPTSNKVMLGVLDAAGRVNVTVWSGSAWDSYLQVESNAPTGGSRCFDVAFEPRGTRGIVGYGHATTTSLRYRTYDGTSWSNQSSGPTVPGTPFLVQLTPSGGGTEIMALLNCTGGQNRLEFMRWNGTSFVNVQELEPNVSGPAGAEVFMVPDEPPINVPRVIYSWTEAAP